eukprot:5097679-Prorocentrum_lima.AAC.1
MSSSLDRSTTLGGTSKPRELQSLICRFHLGSGGPPMWQPTRTRTRGEQQQATDEGAGQADICPIRTGP